MPESKQVVIAFQGVLLFVAYKDCVEVLIPRGEKGSPPVDLDEDRPHFPWLTSWNPGFPENADLSLRESLLGADITIAGPEATTGCPDGISMLRRRLFSINPVVDIIKTIRPRNNPTAEENRRFTATRITLKGGEFFTEKQDLETLGLELPNPKGGTGQTRSVVATTIRWRIAAEAVELKWRMSGNLRRTIRLTADGGPYYVANLDCPTPELCPKKIDPPVDTEDADFRWLYHLYGLKTKAEWRDVRLATGGGRPLPVPFVTETRCLSDPKCHHALVEYNENRA